MTDSRVTESGATDSGRDACTGTACDTRCGDVHAGAIFCDGFELPGVTAWDDTYVRDGLLERRTDEVYLGLGALYSQVDLPRGQAAVLQRMTAIGSGHVYLRAYVYLPGDVSVAGGIGVLEVGEDTSPYHHAAFSVLDGYTELYSIAAGADTYTLAAGPAFPTDEWRCVELHVELSSSAGVVELFIEDELEAQITGVPTTPAAGFDRIVVGSTHVATDQPGSRIRIDEVVLDDERVFCD